MSEDYHDFKGKLERKLNKLDSIPDVSERNKELIREFSNECYAERLSHGRVCKLVYFLIALARLLGKDFDKAEKEDLKELIRKIEASPKNYTENTKKDFRVVIKKFYKWLEGNNEEYPEKVKWLKTTEKNNSKKLPEDLLTREEIRQMINAASTPRDKALIFALYESGCRIGELMSLKLKNIQFDKYGAQIIVSGKTGARRIRLIESIDYLRYWLENHPERSNPEAYVWVNMSNAERGRIQKPEEEDRRLRILEYAAVRKRVKDIAEKAGIKKKVNPHNFRHSRATHLASKLKTAQLCVMFGWAQHSRMPSTYLHLSGDDIDDALLKMHGLKKEDDGDTISCPRCKVANKPTANYCEECGMPFNVKVIAEAEEERDKYDKIMSKLMDNPEVKKSIKKALEDLK